MAKNVRKKEGASTSKETESLLTPEQTFQKSLQLTYAAQFQIALTGFHTAAQGKYPPAYLYLAVLYKEGLGIKKDASKAEYYSDLVKENLAYFKDLTETDAPFDIIFWEVAMTLVLG